MSKSIDVAQLKKLIQFNPHPGQREILKNLERFTIVVTGKRFGKCESLDAPILMADGTWKKLADVNVGDFVIGVDYETGLARPTEVVATSRSGMKPIYRVTFVDGGFVEASLEHEFPVKFRSGKAHEGKENKFHKETLYKIFERGTGQSCSKKTKFLQPKEVVFDTDGNLPLHPYLLGALIGDGSLKYGLSFTNEDKEVVDRVNTHLNSVNHYLKRNKRKDIQYYIVSTSGENWMSGCSLKRTLKELGIYPSGADNKFIPRQYLTASVESRKELLAGLIDTDGSMYEFTTKSERLADDFIFLIKSLGGRARKKYSVRNFTYKGEKKESYAWRCYWNLNTKLPLSLPRKQGTKQQVYCNERTVKSIEYVGEKETGDIQVAHPKHCYVSYDWITTGNSLLCAYLALRELFLPYHVVWLVAPNYELTSRVWDYIILWIDKYLGGTGKGEGGMFEIDRQKHTIYNKHTGAQLAAKSCESPESLLGKGLNLLIIDEASRIDPKIWEGYLKPNLMDVGGNAIMISNPFGMNWFYDEYIRGTPDGRLNYPNYISFKFPTAVEDKDGNVIGSNNPAISVDELKFLKSTMPASTWLVEVMGEFQEGAGMWFRGVDACIDESIKIPNPDEWFEDPIPGHLYFVGVDIGKVEDFTVVTVIDRMTHRVVGFYRVNQMTWMYMRERVKEISQRYFDAEITLDATGNGGDEFAEDLANIGANIDTEFVYSPKTKRLLMDKLLILVDRKKIKFPKIPQLIYEMRAFTYEFTNRGNVILGSSKKDDCVNSLALACWKLNEEPLEDVGRYNGLWKPRKKNMG